MDNENIVNNTENVEDIKIENKIIKDRDIKIKMTPIKWISIFAIGIISAIINFIVNKNIIECGQVAVIAGLLTYMSLVDIELHLAPDWISLCIFGATIPTIVLNIIDKNWTMLIDMVVGLLICFIPLIIAAIASKGGIGGADIKLMMVLGLYLGTTKAFFTLVIGLLLAVIFNLIKIALKKSNKNTKFALVPFLALGSLYFIII